MLFYFFISRMKKALLLIFLATIVLAGCGQQKLSQDQLFEKKQECANLNKDIENEAKSYYTLYKLSEVFYSPKLNDCLYLVEISYKDSSLKDYDIKSFFEKTLILTSNDKVKIDKQIKELKWE